MRLTTNTPAMVPLDEIDLYAPESYRSGDLHGAWRTLRVEKPVWRQQAPDGTTFWSVTRYADVMDVLRDTRRFSSNYSTMLTVLGDGDPVRGQAIQLLDPPLHTQMRSHLIPTLTTRAMRAQEGCIAARVRRLVTDSVAEGEFDFADIARLLPMMMAGEIIGIPEDKWPETARWTVASIAPEEAGFAADDRRMALLEAHTHLFTLFADLCNLRRQQPGEDLISLLTTLRIDGRAATDDEITANCYGFLMGATITVAQASTHFVRHVVRRPQLWKWMRDQPSIVPLLVDETLRWATPINHLLRRATEEVRLGDETVPEGGLVAAWLASANRDEEEFADPYSFDATRRPNPHVTFGYGAHRCIGQATASVGLKLLLEELIAQIDSFEQIGEERHWADNFFNGISILPVRARPVAGRR